MKMQGLSVVIPVYNEQDNVQPLAEEVVAALQNKLPYEIIYVDDASQDKTIFCLENLSKQISALRFIRHSHNKGQSAAVITGVRQSRYPWVATLDGDRQNNPHDLCKMITILAQEKDKNILCMGSRVDRQDNWLRKISSKIANGVRRRFLKDDCPDSGCGIKIFPRDFFLALPLFRNCHRFLPALFRRAGGLIICVPVSHRHRVEGRSKYGVMNRLWVGIVDLFGVAWLMRRFIDQDVE